MYDNIEKIIEMVQKVGRLTNNDTLELRMYLLSIKNFKKLNVIFEDLMDIGAKNNIGFIIGLVIKRLIIEVTDAKDMLPYTFLWFITLDRFVGEEDYILSLCKILNMSYLKIVEKNHMTIRFSDIIVTRSINNDYDDANVKCKGELYKKIMSKFVLLVKGCTGGFLFLHY